MDFDSVPGHCRHWHYTLVDALGPVEPSWDIPGQNHLISCGYKACVRGLCKGIYFQKYGLIWTSTSILGCVEVPSKISALKKQSICRGKANPEATGCLGLENPHSGVPQLATAGGLGWFLGESENPNHQTFQSCRAIG